MDALYEKLLYGGGYSLPYLVHLYDGARDGSTATTHIRLINDSRDLVWEGETYLASGFDFAPSDDGESSLRITVEGNGLKTLMDSEYVFNAEFTGILLEDGSVTPIRGYRRNYGTATWSGKEAEINFDTDDRLGMTFPALIFNAYNNRGNS
jgi:hypothetical protein